MARFRLRAMATGDVADELVGATDQRLVRSAIGATCRLADVAEELTGGELVAAAGDACEGEEAATARLEKYGGARLDRSSTSCVCEKNYLGSNTMLRNMQLLFPSGHGPIYIHVQMW